MSSLLLFGDMNFAACTASMSSFSSASSRYREPMKYSFCRLRLQTTSKPLFCSSAASSATVFLVVEIPMEARYSMISFVVAGCSSSVCSHRYWKMYRALFLWIICVLPLLVYGDEPRTARPIIFVFIRFSFSLRNRISFLLILRQNSFQSAQPAL